MPNPSATAMKIRKDVPYSAAHQDRRLLDWYLPDSPNGAAILWIHGGGWNGGSKGQWSACCERYAARGITCASAEYRFPPAVTLDGIVADCRLAMAAMRAAAATHGYRPDRIAAAGSSAGGHLVAMLATIAATDPLGADPELADPHTAPDLAICYCPVTRLYAHPESGGYDSPTGRGLLGVGADVDPAVAPERFRVGSPLDRLSGNEPPFLFLTGDADDTVPHRQSTEMHRLLLEQGTDSRLIMLAGVGHGFGYGVGSPAQQQALRQIDRFLADHWGV